MINSITETFINVSQKRIRIYQKNIMQQKKCSTKFNSKIAEQQVSFYDP